MTISTPEQGEQASVAELLAERYGSQACAPAVAHNAIVAHILRHRSVRAFLPRPLPAEVLPTMLAAAQSGSTSSNLQVWSVVAIEDPSHKERLSAWANDQAFVRQAPLFLVWLADYARARRLASLQGAQIDGGDYVESVVLGAVDTAIAAQNAMLAAESLGLGAVYVGAIRSHVSEIAKDLKLPPHVFPVFGMAVGYPDQAVPAHIKPRLPQSGVLHREHYDAGAQEQAAQIYDRALDAFWKKQSISHPLWTRHIVRRLTANPADRRYALRSVLNELGFPLR
ncbi:NADPH-dependent oxidoreductase [Orrella sp. JC864]|uniref:NADPH-dependent oxidoreductase n=1 Tax=Orrella sp. JC864 TaxID=3120298 RepID=UPI0030094CC1